MLHSAHYLKMIIAIVVGLHTVPVFADVERGRDFMNNGRFKQAMQAFLPAARSGNADAEELIGVLYSIGLGVERDDVRAFEWTLRAAMKAHPAAQATLGWYYEEGRGTNTPDPVRAYMWYSLAAIGGDPDGEAGLEKIALVMTSDQINKAKILVDDYKKWLYPFD